MLFLVVFALIATSPQIPPAAPKVGPPRGTLIGTGGGTTPEIMAEFIKAAGGPNALIIVIPTSSAFGGDSTGLLVGRRVVGGVAIEPTEEDVMAPLKSAGAKNVQVLHTRERNTANSDSFVGPLKRATGVWTTGGNPDLFMDAYGGTKTEQELRNLLERGGVIGGPSAGAIILGSKGPPSPANRTYFGFARGVVFWPHMTTMNQLPAFQTHASQHPEVINLAADEPTGWLIRGDIATIIGAGNAFVYGDDPGNSQQYITLHRGDQYNLATRAVTRAITGR
jgi:cyanophycinase